MNCTSKPVKCVICIILFVFGFVDGVRAHTDIVEAYIDPGTGSLILQILLAVVVGAGFAVKIFWTKIMSFFSKLFGPKRDGDDK